MKNTLITELLTVLLVQDGTKTPKYVTGKGRVNIGLNLSWANPHDQETPSAVCTGETARAAGHPRARLPSVSELSWV